LDDNSISLVDVRLIEQVLEFVDPFLAGRPGISDAAAVTE
jgi:hypothetical protein